MSKSELLRPLEATEWPLEGVRAKIPAIFEDFAHVLRLLLGVPIGGVARDNVEIGAQRIRTSIHPH